MALKTAKDLVYRSIENPNPGLPKTKPELGKAVYELRQQKLLARMAEQRLDAVVIYADREHCQNFKYFAGFDPRFEEALLVIHAGGTMFAALGNECMPLVVNSKLPMAAVLCQPLSLPSQPMEQFVSMEKTLAECGLKAGMRVGAIDWKLITEKHGANYRHMSAMPSFLYQALIDVCGAAELVTNETALLIDPAGGLRVSYGADEIAELEYGAALASQAVIDMAANLRPGMSEKELANFAKGYGQPQSCHMMVCGGASVKRGMISPTDRVIELGEDINLVYALEGGLSCRHAVVGKSAADVAYDGEVFIEQVIKPYLAAVFNWYEMMRVGAVGGDIYAMVETCFPKERYGWFLNPGHLTGLEEWLSSPIYAGSPTPIKSGTLIQMDIIPNAPGYCSPNNEDGVCVADAALRAELKQKHPEVYARMMARREFMITQLGVALHDDVLPLSNLAGAYKPYFLADDMAITIG